MFPHGVTVTVERPTGADRYGNPSPPTSHTLDGVAFAPAGSSEMVDRSATVEWDQDLLIGYDDDLRAEDVVIDGDDRYRVHGRPERWLNPMSGWAAGGMARLKAVTG